MLSFLAQDFGLSRLQDTVLITAHVDVGTAPYMAPEALDARNCVITHHSDMYSYGIMLYEMLAGARPWRGMNMLQVRGLWHSGLRLGHSFAHAGPN